MALIPTYKDLDSKKQFFNNGSNPSFQIDSKEELDIWFEEVESHERDLGAWSSTSFIYRGLGEANYKLLTSAQRIWIQDEMSQWSKDNYIGFINRLITNANKNKLIDKVFQLYNYSIPQRDFPILSLLQHYGAPTPLMDWTYNNYVAFYFATEKLKNSSHKLNDINNYFSIYRINKRKYINQLLNIIDVMPSERHPSIDSLLSYEDESRERSLNPLFYLSDFEEKGESIGKTIPNKKLLIRTRKPLTLTYNQNIIPQEGLFIFNPFSDKTLEEIFGVNNMLNPFDCFNINKDLGEYLKRKIDIKNNINKSFIFPELKKEAKSIKESTLNGLI